MDVISIVRFDNPRFKGKNYVFLYWFLRIQNYNFQIFWLISAEGVKVLRCIINWTLGRMMQITCKDEEWDILWDSRRLHLRHAPRGNRGPPSMTGQDHPSHNHQIILHSWYLVSHTLKTLKHNRACNWTTPFMAFSVTYTICEGLNWIPRGLKVLHPLTLPEWYYSSM